MKLLQPDDLDLSAYIRPGDGLIWGQASAEPLVLTRALMAQRHALQGPLEAFIGATWSDVLAPEQADVIRFRSYCGAGANRKLARAGVLDLLPVHYSQLASLIRSRHIKADVLLLQVAPADADGRYSLSLASEYLLAAIDVARTIIVEINEQAPHTFGERSLSADDISIAIETSRPPLGPPRGAPGAAERAVAARVADLIEDGATLQFGIGGIPEAVLAALGNRRDLGIHTGALGDAAVDLIESGVINNARKSRDAGIAIAGLAMGGPKLHRFLHGNRSVQFRSVEYTHDAQVLASHDRLAAINSAVEVDLTGQINAEVAGGTYVGAVGGAIDFLRAAHRSRGGLPIVALAATVGEGEKCSSRIVARLSGPVSTPRSDTGLIVTEYGVADLRGLSLSQRIARMIEIAAPEFREGLARAAAERDYD